MEFSAEPGKVIKRPGLLRDAAKMEILHVTPGVLRRWESCQSGGEHV